MDSYPRSVLTELPDASPRYVVLSYELKHSDGRISFPLVMINWTPVGSETGLLTLHASALIAFQSTVCSGIQRAEENLTNSSFKRSNPIKFVRGLCGCCLRIC